MSLASDKTREVKETKTDNPREMPVAPDVRQNLRESGSSKASSAPSGAIRRQRI